MRHVEPSACAARRYQKRDGECFRGHITPTVRLTVDRSDPQGVLKPYRRRLTLYRSHPSYHHKVVIIIVLSQKASVSSIIENQIATSNLTLRISLLRGGLVVLPRVKLGPQRVPPRVRLGRARRRRRVLGVVPGEGPDVAAQVEFESKFRKRNVIF